MGSPTIELTTLELGIDKSNGSEVLTILL